MGAKDLTPGPSPKGDGSRAFQGGHLRQVFEVYNLSRGNYGLAKIYRI